jgi:hypothetical protein
MPLGCLLSYRTHHTNHVATLKGGASSGCSRALLFLTDGVDTTDNPNLAQMIDDVNNGGTIQEPYTTTMTTTNPADRIEVLVAVGSANSNLKSVTATVTSSSGLYCPDEVRTENWVGGDTFPTINPHAL